MTTGDRSGAVRAAAMTVAAALAACGGGGPTASVKASAPPSGSTRNDRASSLPLPGASGVVILDYLACDRAAGRVWVPAGSLGDVDVIDGAAGTISAVHGFPTA